MKHLLINKMKKIAGRIIILLACTLFTVLTANSQNINIPNKTGPMGLEVNSYTGNLFFDRTDFVIGGTGLDMSIKFAYNSYSLDSNRGFGKGWSFLYDVHYVMNSSDSVTIVWGDGREDKYAPLGNGKYKATIGHFDELKEYEPGKFSLTQTNGKRYLFENSTLKQLTKIDEPNGNFISVQYAGSLITSLTNNYGQTIQLAYDGKGLLKTVTDAITTPTRTWNYSYDGLGNLISVTDPLGAKDGYSYLINGPVKSVTDKNFNVVDLVYYNDFALSEMVGCNKRMSFSYDSAQKVTVITEYMESGENQVTKYNYKSYGKSVWLSSVSGNCCGFDATMEYDQNGNRLRETDANGNATTYTYDNNGNILTITNAMNQTATYTYIPTFNRVKSVKDPKGNIVTMDYDSKGNLLKITEPGGEVYSATYNSLGNLTSSTNPKGKTFTYTYGANGKLQNVTGPEGTSGTLNVSPRGDVLGYTDGNNRSSTYQYDILGRMTQITDPLNNKSTYSYDGMGNIVLVKNKLNEPNRFQFDASNRMREISSPLGSKLVLGYDGMDNVTSVTNGEGATANFKYDNKNLLSTIIDAEGNETTLSHDRNGNIITARLPVDITFTYTYDVLNRLKGISDQNAMLASFEYDQNGNVLQFKDASGSVNQFEYDNQNRIKKYTNALGNSIELTYNQNGRIITSKDRMGNVSAVTYDDLDRIKTLTDNNGSVTKVGYDAEDNVVSLTDANNNITSYTYDELNRVKRTTYPDAKYEDFSYDLKNNIISVRTRDGNTIIYTYDSLSRLKTKTLPEGQLFSYTYNKIGQVISATNAAGTVYFTYDLLKRVSSEKFNGRTVNYSYDVNGRTQKTIYPDGIEIAKSFDIRNRLVSIQKNNVTLVTYQYNNADQVIGKVFANGLNTSLQYDFGGRLTNIVTGSIQNLSFNYDKNGNKTSIIRGTSDKSEFFTYDNGNRLNSFKRGKAGGPFTVNDTYNYDALGNRVSANIGGKNTSYSINQLNQLVSSNDGTKTINYTYDINGNLTFDGKYFKIYNLEKQLLKDSASPAEVITYQYDPIGRKITKTLNGIASHYTYAGFQMIEERNQYDFLKTRTVFNNFLEPVLNEKDNVSYYFHQNHLNSVESLTDGNGNLKEQYGYDVYGKQTIYDANGNVIPGSLTGNRFGFTGQLYDSATRHNQFVFRNYNPETGLFDQQDLIGYADGMGLYQYVGNNPANGLDIWGLQDCGSTTIKSKNTSTTITKKTKKEVEFSWTLFISKFSDVYTINSVLEFIKTSKLAESSFNSLLLPLSVLGIGDGINTLSNWNSNNAAQNTEGSLNLVSGLAGTYSGGMGLAAVGTGNTISVTSLASATGGTATVTGAAGASIFFATGVAGGLAIYGLADLGFKLFLGDGRSIAEASYEGYFDDFAPVAGWNSMIRDSWTRSNNKKTQELINWHKDRWYEAEISVINRREWYRTHTGKDCPPYNGTQKPRGGGDGTSGKTQIVASIDPNEIIGPEGQPDKRWVSVNDRLPYTVTYENAVMATAPAKYVKVIVPVHEKMDPTTFQLSNLGFNNMTFNVPASSASNYQRLDARDSLGLFIDMTAGFDPMKNEFFWEFQSIDPVTYMSPADPLKGFLLTQDTSTVKSNNGHGFVNFTIKPMANSQTLDSILAFASIVFDQNDTIPTNIEKNVIDAAAPTSQMSELSENYTNFIPLTWSGQDDPNGCGIRSYTLYVSTDGVNYNIVKTGITRTDTTFTGLGNTRYYFFVLATDSVGNTEALKAGAVKNTYLGSVTPVTWLYFKGTNRDKDNLLEWATANETNTKEFRVERSFDAQNFKGIGTVKAAGNTSGNSSYNYTDYDIDRLNESVMYYRLAQIDQDGRTKFSNVIRLNYHSKASAKTMVYPNPTKGMMIVVVGDPTLIGTIASVYDEAGKLLQSVKITSVNQQINLGNYTNGIYFIKLANKETLIVIKQ